jgi:signal transduction histidine kinase
LGAQGLYGTLVLAAIFIGVVFFVFQAERRAWESRQVEAARNAARTLEDFISQTQAHLKLIGALGGDYLADHPTVFFEADLQKPALLEVVYLDKDGNIYGRAFQDESPVLANLFTVPQSNWFSQASAGNSYIGDLQVSSKNRPYLVLAVPALNGGVVAGRLRMDMLWNVVDGIHFGETGHAYVVDRRAYVVAYPDPQIVLARTSLAGRAEMEAVLQDWGHQWKGSYVNLAGEQVLGVATPVEGVEWVMFTEITEHEAFAVTRLALIVMGIGGLAFGLVLASGTRWLLDRIVIRPLRKLRDGAERVGMGDLDYRLEQANPDEIGQVAATFNEMAASLKLREMSLAQVRDEALAASSFKSRLLANVSHDLRTPLSGILGYADMLKDGTFGELNSEQVAALNRILANTQRQMNLITGLLDRAQIEAGKLTLRYESFKPVDLLKEAEAVMSLLAHKKQLQLVVELDPALPALLQGDAQRIQQILMNLLENAIKFTSQGQVRARFGLDVSNQPPTHWLIEVSDTGKGIPAEAQVYIFEPFRQVEGSPSHSTVGIGLGLSIVRQLVALMGGEISLESVEGQGSTFRVRLPLEPPKAEQDHLLSSEEEQ